MDGSETMTDGLTPASRGRTGGVEPATNCATRQRAVRLYFVRGCSAAVAVLARSLGSPTFSQRISKVSAKLSRRKIRLWHADHEDVPMIAVLGE